MYKAKGVVHSAVELRALMGEVYPTGVNKVVDHIDVHCRTWIERTPFIVISSASASGAMDVSPKGDPAGFVKVLDDETLAIPDRLGNNRGDTFSNVLENPRVGIMFVIPKRTEVLRVSGSAQVVADNELLAQMSVHGKVPHLALLVRVEEAMFHRGKSMIRSRLWKPEEWISIEGLPTFAQALKSHGDLPNPLAELESLVAENESDNLY
jgi:PPOX class probable FMN-dependent enzyme